MTSRWIDRERKRSSRNFRSTLTRWPPWRSPVTSGAVMLPCFINYVWLEKPVVRPIQSQRSEVKDTNYGYLWQFNLIVDWAFAQSTKFKAAVNVFIPKIPSNLKIQRKMSKYKQWPHGSLFYLDVTNVYSLRFSHVDDYKKSCFEIIWYSVISLLFRNLSLFFTSTKNVSLCNCRRNTGD